MRESLPVVICLSILTVALVRAALAPKLPFEHWATELPLEGIIVAAVAAVIREVRLRRVRRHIRLLNRIVQIDTGHAQRPLLVWLEHYLENARQGVHNLLGEGWTLDHTHYNALMSRFSRSAPKVPYVATTADVPSVFFRRYSWVFESRPAQYDPAHTPLRVLIADPEDLLIDQAREPELYGLFVDWHTNHGVDLACICKSDFALLNQIYDAGEYMTFWDGKYAVLLQPLVDKRAPEAELAAVKTALVLAQDEGYNRLTTYVTELRLKITSHAKYEAAARASSATGRVRPAPTPLPLLPCSRRSCRFRR
jgi:hypothetical protein